MLYFDILPIHGRQDKEENLDLFKNIWNFGKIFDMLSFLELDLIQPWWLGGRAVVW